MSTINTITGRATNDLSFARIGYENKITSALSAVYDAVLIPNTWERWESASGTVTASFNIAPASKVNYIAIAAHNLFTAGVTEVRVECVDSGLSSFVTVGSIRPTSNSPIFFEFDDFDGCARITVTLVGGTNREIGVIYAGEVLIMQQALYGGHTPINLASVTDYRNAMSDTGQFLGRTIRRRGLSSSFAWQNLTEQWYRDTFKPFVDSAKEKPFFIQWRPDYQTNEVAFGYTTGDIAPNNQAGVTRLVSVNMSMRAHDE